MRPKRIKKQKSIFKNKFFWILVFFVAFFCSLFYLALILDTFQIKIIQVKENDAILRSKVQELVGQSIQKKILFFNTRSIFLFDSRHVEGVILNAFPEVETLQMKRNLPNSLVVTIHKRQEVALWCKTREQCFALDAKGVIFKEKKPQNEFLIFSSSKDFVPELGELALPQELASFLFAFWQKAGIQFASVIIVSNSQIQYKTSEGWEVYCNPKENLKWQITKLQTVLEKKKPVATGQKLEYIDVRFGDQAYIKYRSP